MSKTKQPAKAFTRKPCVIATGLALTLMAAQSVYAQQAAAPQVTEKVERLEVTGSRIRSISADSASPLQVITSADIAASGATNVQELLLKNPTMGTPTISRTNSNFSTASGGDMRQGPILRRVLRPACPAKGWSWRDQIVRAPSDAWPSATLYNIYRIGRLTVYPQETNCE